MNTHLSEPRGLTRALVAALTVLCLGFATLAQAQLEYEGFNYSGTAIIGQGGGIGWSGNWANTNGNAALTDDGVSLSAPTMITNVPIGSRLTFTGPGVIERALGTTMTLGGEGATFYFSALVKYQGAFKFEFWDSSVNARWRIGATNDRQSALFGIAADLTVANIFPTNESVLVVARMLTHSSASDQVTLSVFRSGDVIPATEPTAWQATNTSASGVVLTRLRIQNLMALPLEVDEIRIGSSWASVAGASAAGPPSVTRQPVSASVYQNSDAQLLVEATGTSPFSYQWRHDGSPLLNATNPVLVLTNVQPAQAGSYTVTISNSQGSTNSNPAILDVVVVTNISVGLRALWHFDETTGLVAHDATTNHFDGTLTNFVGDNSQWVASDYNGALTFSGSNFVEVPDRPAIGSGLVNGFSVATWIRSRVALSTNGNLYRVFEKENSIFLVQGDGNAANGVGIGGMNALVKKNGTNFPVSIGQSLNADMWYHIATTFDGKALKIYLDGQLKDSRAVASPIDTTALPIHIGSDYATANSKYFPGSLDEVGIWDRALTPSEIGDLSGQSGPPVVVEQPQPQTQYPGSVVSFSVRARGLQPLHYQWLLGTNEIRGANSSVLSLVNIQPADAGEYRCRVANDLAEVPSNPALLTLIAITNIAQASLALWHFDETTGFTAADSSGQGRTGQLTDYPDASAQWGAGRFGSALGFDGISNRVLVTGSDTLNLGSDSSVAFWIYPTNYGTRQYSGATGYYLSTGRVLRKASHLDIETVDDPGTVRATLRINGVPAPQQNILALNEWQHFAIIFSAGRMSIYKNGFLVGAPVTASPGAANTNILILGNQVADMTATNMFAGTLDEVGLWNRVLGETEILGLAARDTNGAPVIVTPPQSAVRFAGGSVTFSVDATGKRPLTYEWRHDGTPIPNSNSNHLTLTNLTVADAGGYTVNVQNDVSAQLSTPAANLVVQQITNVATGLTAYWPMNETDGNILHDISGRGHDGVIQGSAAFSGGVVSNCLSFDGTSTFAVVPHASDLSLGGQATIALWISPRALGATGNDHPRFVRKDINFEFNIATGGARLAVYGANKVEYSSPNNSVDLNAWQHVAVVIKEGTIQFFKNGRALSQAVPGLLGPGVTNDLIIGNFGPDLSINRLFNGYMDELGIWERALTPDEIDGVYQNGLTGMPLNAPFIPFKVTEFGPTNSQLRMVFSSPYGGRPHVVQRKDQLDGTNWTDQASVTMTDLGSGRALALFPPASGAAFYRVAALPLADIFFENFETGGTNWTHAGTAIYFNDTWQVGIPTNPNGPSSAFSGTNAAGTGLHGNVIGGTDSHLRSPAISLTNITRATLSFREWRSVDPDVTFHWTYVNVLDANGNLITQLTTKTAGTTTGWQLRTMPLTSDLLGRSIILEFVISTDEVPDTGVPGWFLDDVKISRE